jgi:hypothetical protein
VAAQVSGGPIPGFEDTEEAVYRESVRTLDEQAKVLDGVRSRAATIVAVAS